ncbi:MAG: nucleoid occlusion factor SlmA [Pseudomonadota bacterium]
MARPAPGERRRQILEALARELESGSTARITTARLAATVGVSEAALYRHFRSKGAMYEALIEFAEVTVFGVVKRIAAEPWTLEQRVSRIVSSVLTFAERNPGICRVLLGEGLAGEAPELRVRASQFFERIETEFRSLFREAELARAGGRGRIPASQAAALIAAVLEGRLSRFSRLGFRIPATAGWDIEWSVLTDALIQEQA